MNPLSRSVVGQVLRSAAERLKPHLPAVLVPRAEWAPGSRSHLVPTFADLAEEVPEARVPRLDRSVVDESRLSAYQRDWRRDGVVILKGFMPHDLIDSPWERSVRARAAISSSFVVSAPPSP